MLTHAHLPTPLSEQAPVLEFSEARARVHLETIVNFGVRTVGTDANEVHTPRYLLDAVRAIARDAHTEVEVEYGIQHVKPSAFNLDFLGGFTNVYGDIQNVVARVSRKGDAESKKDAVLVSAHYDSALGSPAASDDAVSIAAMMEMLRLFSSAPMGDVALVFNFNGAEETILQAAHGFITQHKSAATIRYFVNLEAVGAGGREMLFQSGPGNGWLTREYVKNAPYPFGTVLGQEIFQSAIIPSDTDYRIYRDHGHLAGMDIAYVTNGYVYHTSRDDVAHIPSGAIQRCGTNMVALIRGILAAPQVKGGHNDTSSVVFFDILGLFMVVYGKTVGTVLHLGVGLGALAFVHHIAKRRDVRSEDGGAWKPLLQRALKYLGLSILAAILVPMCIGAILHATGFRMRWFATPTLASVIFGAPSLLAMMHVQWMSEPPGSEYATAKEQRQSEMIMGYAATTLWAMLTVLTALCGLGSAYIPAIVTAALVAARFLFEFEMNRITVQKVRIGNPPPNIAVSAVVILMAILALPLLILIQIDYALLDFFIPLMGRAGVVPSDVVVGALTGVIVAITASLTISLVHLSNQPTKLKIPLILLVALGLALTVILPPYSEEHPKRLYQQHITRTFFDTVVDDTATATPASSDSAVWINCFDSLCFLPLRHLPTIANADLMPTKGVYDGLPWYLPVRDLVKGGLSVKAPAIKVPAPYKELRIRVTERSVNTTTGAKTTHFAVSGSDHMACAVESAADLLAWSFSAELPPWHTPGHEHFVYYASGSRGAEWTFWVETADTGPVKVAFWAHYLSVHTKEVLALHEQLPSYVDDITWASAYTVLTI